MGEKKKEKNRKEKRLKSRTRSVDQLLGVTVVGRWYVVGKRPIHVGCSFDAVAGAGKVTCLSMAYGAADDLRDALRCIRLT
jgi:hypothetical protein